AGHAAGRLQASFHYGRLHRICRDASASDHLNEKVDLKTRRQTVAVAASLDLCRRDCRRGALFVAGQIRYSMAADLRPPFVGLAGVSSFSVVTRAPPTIGY